MKFLNEERFFCRCDSGWSGAQCQIQIDCSNCSSNSICIGSIRNQPICVCPTVVLKIDISYYLAVLQQDKSDNISTTVGSAQRCAPFQELFSSELLALPRIHRLKNYHIPCQNNVDLQCFIDEFYMCLCTVEHQTNCFLFDFNNSFVCTDDVYCENGGACLQDRPQCPESILCACVDCFFGDRCQFYAKGIGLTLDDMLRYAIRPNIAFNKQSTAIKLSAALTMVIFVVGWLN
ncbi:unnamed protein product, partial [Rotaria magnacalcarata]